VISKKCSCQEIGFPALALRRRESLGAEARLHRGCRLGQGENFIELVVNELDGYLHSRQGVFARKINGPLRMLKIMPLEWIRRPVPQTSQVELRANVLQ